MRPIYMTAELGKDRILLTFYTDSTLRLVKKRGIRTKFARMCLQYTFWGADLFLIRDYATVHAISDITTEADVRMKKLVRIRVLASFESNFSVV